MKKFLLVFLLFASTALASDTLLGFRQTLSGTAAVVSAWDGNRQSILIRNLDASINIYVGPVGVTTSGATGGQLVKPQEWITLYTRASIYAIAASGTPSIAVTIEK